MMAKEKNAPLTRKKKLRERERERERKSGLGREMRIEFMYVEKRFCRNAWLLSEAAGGTRKEEILK